MEGIHVAQRPDEPGREAHAIRAALGVAGNLHLGVEHGRIDEIAGVLQLDGGRLAAPGTAAKAMAARPNKAGIKCRGFMDHRRLGPRRPQGKMALPGRACLESGR